MLLEFRGSNSPAAQRLGVNIGRIFFDPKDVTSVMELMTPVGNGSVIKPEALVNIRGAGNLTVQDDDRDTAKRINAALSEGSCYSNEKVSESEWQRLFSIVCEIKARQIPGVLPEVLPLLEEALEILK